jgi:hypothetical protein
MDVRNIAMAMTLHPTTHNAAEPTCTTAPDRRKAPETPQAYGDVGMEYKDPWATTCIEEGMRRLDTHGEATPSRTHFGGQNVGAGTEKGIMSRTGLR